MKEKIKTYLFCLCAMAMCLAFALAVFFRASKNIKAAPIMEGSNITYNEFQPLLAVANNVPYVININSNGTYYQFLLRPYNVASNSRTYTYNRCAVTSSSSTTLVFTCDYLFYFSDTLSTSVAIEVSKPIITFNKTDINDVSDTITFDRVYTGINATSYHSNVVFSTNGTTYYDGYTIGYANATHSIYNDLYYIACLQYSNNSSCSKTYFDKYLPLTPTVAVVLDEVLAVYGKGNLNKVSYSVYDFIRRNYESNNDTACSISSQCVSWSSDALTISNLEFGLNAYITNSDIISSSLIYDDAYTTGRLDGVSVGVEEGKVIGYQQGFLDGQETEDILGNSILSVASTPLMILSGMLSFDILGFSVYHLVLALFTFLLVIYILKKVF